MLVQKVLNEKGMMITINNTNGMERTILTITDSICMSQRCLLKIRFSYKASNIPMIVPIGSDTKALTKSKFKVSSDAFIIWACSVAFSNNIISYHPTKHHSQ